VLGPFSLFHFFLPSLPPSLEAFSRLSPWHAEGRVVMCLVVSLPC